MEKKQKFKPGDRVRIVDSHTGHTVPVGTTGRVVARAGGGYYTVVVNKSQNLNFHYKDLALAVYTAEELAAEKAKLLEAVEDINAKLAYLEKTGLSEFDEEEFKIHRAIELLDSTACPVERTRQLAKLLRGDS
jgi:predicted GNAT family acetyltransferase